MNYIYATLLAAIGSVIPFSMAAQNPICIGTRHSLFSRILNEEREYWVYVPEGHEPDSAENFPVLYLLDGNVFYHSVVGFTRFFSSSKASSLAPCIVIAVLNTDRTRDFTPTSSAARRDGTLHPGDKPKGGGAENFYRFLTEELRPEVERRISRSGSNFLVGHSYAGLFALEVLLRHPEAFDTFMAIDPSLWWDRGIILKQWEEKIREKDFSGKQLYLAFATRKRPGVKLNQFLLADSLKVNIVPDMEKHHLRVIYRNFPEEVHGTVALPGIFDGLNSLFRR